jgi:hypothetical protein
MIARPQSAVRRPPLRIGQRIKRMERMDVAGRRSPVGTEDFSRGIECFLKDKMLLSGSAKAEHYRFCSLSKTLIFQRAGLNYRIEL